MHTKTQFLEFSMAQGVLRFGRFRLKSGRVSPYFFNAGLFDSGAALAELGRFYAHAIRESEIAFDMLFGPAYKGIPLVATTAIALADRYGLDVPYAFNRKEIKSHGEGGGMVGAALSDRVLIVDDVITAGTALREAIEIIRAEGARPVGVVIALDRQERGQGHRSTIQEVEQELGLNVIAIVKLADLIDFVSQRGGSDRLEAIKTYRQEYGV